MSTITEQVQGAVWERVADALRAEIESGALKTGDTLPAESDLVGRHKVARTTVRRALAELTREGRITEGRGRLGRQVRGYKPIEWPLWLYESRDFHEHACGPGGDQFEITIRAQGREPSETVEPVIVDPPARVCELLKIKPGELVLVRRRVRSVDGVPFQLADSYFRESLVRGTPLMEPRSVSYPGGLLAGIGHPQARFRDEITVRMPTRAEAEKLSLPAVTPVAEITRIGYAEDGTSLRVMVTIAPGDRHKFVYEMEAS